MTFRLIVTCHTGYYGLKLIDKARKRIDGHLSEKSIFHTHRQRIGHRIFSRPAERRHIVAARVAATGE